MRGTALGRRVRSGAAVFACASAVVLAGIPGAPAWAAVEEGEVAQVVVEEGAESPAAVFEGMKAAAEAKDYDALVRLYTPEYRRALAAHGALQVWQSSMPGWADPPPMEGVDAEELEALRVKVRTLQAGYAEMRKKYGGPVFDRERDMRPEGLPDETLDKMVASVGDGTAFWADYLRVNGQAGDDHLPKLLRMEDGRHDGWQAGIGAANVTFLNHEGQEQTEVMDFLRIDGRWYFDLDPEFREHVESVFGDRLAP